MSQYSISEAEVRLSELARRALSGEEIIIVGGDTLPVKLVPAQYSRQPRRPGSGKGQLLWMAPDFDAIPDGFEDYI